MSARRDAPKKPSGGRPPPRRLFSIDSLRRDKSGSESDSSSVASKDTAKLSRKPSNAQILYQLTEKPGEERDTLLDQDDGILTEKQLVQSPEQVDVFGLDRETKVKVRAPKPVPLNLAKTLDALESEKELVPSPSKRRWDTLRSHVVPSPTTSSHGPGTPSQGQQPDASRPGTPPSSRPQTPRGYRFGQKKIFRQVVDQAREVAVDESRKLAEEISRACWAVRFGEQPLRQKMEREASQNTVGSSFLPFMGSSASLPMASSVSVASVQTAGRHPLRRPQSFQSMGLTSREPSVTHIARALTYTTSVNRPMMLPHESQVLSALLVPFVELGEPPQVKAGTLSVVLQGCLNTFYLSHSHTGRALALLFSRDSAFTAQTPVIFRTLLQGLFSLLMTLAPSPNAQSEVESLKGFIAAIRNGQCGTPQQPSVEKEYGVRFSKADSDQKIRDVIVTETVILALETGSEYSRRWCMRNLLEEYWLLPEPSLTLTPLLSCIHCRKTKIFVGAVLSLLSSLPKDSPGRLDDVDRIIGVFRSRILPELEAIRDREAAEIQTSVITLVLDLLRIQGNSEREYLLMHFCHWFQDLPEWKANINTTLQDLIANGEWPAILRVLPTIASQFPEEVRSPLISFILPLINDRLMIDSPENPCPPLSEFFGVVSRMYPKLFFKPIFTCAASAKDLTIANQICTLNTIVRFLPDFWARDADMISVALMSGPDGAKAKVAGEGPTWGKVRIGQSVLLVELIEYLRDVRQAKDLMVTAGAVKFASALETRLGVLLEAKEQAALVPIPQRLLFCALFREIRLLTRSLKPASWLSSIVSWSLFQQPVSRDDNLDISDNEEDEETKATFGKLFALYTQAEDASRSTNKRRTTMFMSPGLDAARTISENAAQRALSARLQCLKSLYKALNCTTLELLVSISGLLKPEDYIRLGPVLWSQYLDNPIATVIPPTCFLVMQYAEKRSEDFSRLVESELSSPDPTILSQDVILDRNYRRPFKLARPPILFVPADMGTSYFVLEEDPNDIKDSHGNVLPLELRRRLSEIGWEQEDRVLDPKTQWIRTPMSLLPSQQLDSLDSKSRTTRQPPIRPLLSPVRSLLPRAHPLEIFPFLGESQVLVVGPEVRSEDRDFVVSSTARNLVIDYMRDDPTLLARTTFHLLSGDEQSVISAVTTVRTFLHVRHVLPPAVTHHVMNHLAGFLKLGVRPDAANPLQSYAYSIPSIAKLATQVSKMSMREIRRSKIDPFLVPSGSLWAPPSAPAGPMFPRALEEEFNPFETLPPSLIWITMVRTSQNMFFFNILKRDPQDIKVIRKSMSRLVLPSTSNDNQEPLPLAAYAPRKREPTQDSMLHANPSMTALSLMLARSYLLLVGQIFRAMSRHLSDRQELAVLVDGLNLILLIHGDDIGVVGQAMLAYMIASTRFKRMFISGGGYALFMPAIFKTYCEAEKHPGIRTAIEYAVNRFYASIKTHNAFTLFATLKNGVPPSGPYLAGIHELSRQQEQEALLATVVEEVPQTFLASLRKVGSDKNEVTVEVPDEYEWKSLALDNLVRLFLTVVAHNPAIQRAERFLRLLRMLAPHLYHASTSARSVLREGIDALGSILVTRAVGKGKAAPVNDGAQIRPPDDFSYETLAEGQGSQQALSPSDYLAMRLDFLSLVLAFSVTGGQLGPGAPPRILDLVKVILKDPRGDSTRVATFLADYMRSILLRNPVPSLKEVISLLADYAPVVTAYSTSVDFSGVFDVLATLAGNSIFASEPLFSRLVVIQYCSAGLQACELAASENMLFSLPLRKSLLTLLNRAVSLRGGDILTVIEKHIPSYDFLIGVVLPLILTMKTSVEMVEGQWVERVHREVYTKAWIRLLAYILSACQNPHVPGKSAKSHSPGERSKSQDSRGSTPPANAAMAFTVALQILKIIIIRAEEDLSSGFPGVWAHVGGILKTLLGDGDATFAIRPRDVSEPPSPAQSPRASSLFQQQQDNPFLLPSSISMHTRKHLLPPRLIDYLTWSFIQWFCLRRSPLMIQMRVFMQEKVAMLHQELSLQGTDVSFTSFTSRAGSRNRPMSTIFTKPRRSMFGDTPGSSPGTTPRNSALLAALSLPAFDEASLRISTPRQDKDSRLAGYARTASPVSPATRTQRDSLPRIVHLGPVRTSGFGEPSGSVRRATSPRFARSAFTAARETLVEGPLLVRMTYRRIRLAQAVLGYSTLLPAGEDAEQDDIGVRAWTRAEALDATLQEVRDLMDEFRGVEELGGLGEDSGVLVDYEEPMSPTPFGVG
ncbi:hypothetical protein B0H21DRAFT_857417 [Amylocystis lapponica]|nr:hypothetical protein B0H21DRAFT_857417 [Amylocystis lapponica]